MSILTQPPPSVVFGGKFGIIAAAITPGGGIDHSYTKETATLTLPGSLNPFATAPVTSGEAVFSNLLLPPSKLPLTITVAMTNLNSTTTNPVSQFPQSTIRPGYFIRCRCSAS